MTLSRRSQNRSILQQCILLVAFTLVVIASVIAMTGCGKNEDAHPAGADSVAITPLSEQMQACSQGHHYQGQGWNAVPHAQYDVSPYGAQGCPAGTQQMCDGQYGIVCVPTHYLGNQNVAWWAEGQNGYGFSGYSAYRPMVMTQSPPVYYSGSHGRGYGRSHRRGGYDDGGHDGYRGSPRMGATCHVGTNVCGANSQCRPFQPNRSLGFCAQ